ncbi:MAG TPA: MBL fold metallo-hydrolase [archaeon]|nr:MBL fold metallo-hydrolase [archaeon]
MSIEELENMSLRRSEIAFIWLNDYAGLIVKSPNRVMVIDPAEVNPDDFSKVTVTLITHEHYDHLDESIVGSIHANTKCSVIADHTSYRRLRELIPSDKLIEARIGEKIDVDDINVNVEPSNHPPASTPVSFVIAAENGVTFYHTSDSLPFSEMNKIGLTYKPDITFCTIGIAPGTSPKTGAEIAKLTRPKLAIPYHGTQSSEFIKILSKEAPNIKSMAMQKNKLYKYP